MVILERGRKGQRWELGKETKGVARQGIFRVLEKDDGGIGVDL